MQTFYFHLLNRFCSIDVQCSAENFNRAKQVIDTDYSDHVIVSATDCTGAVVFDWNE